MLVNHRSTHDAALRIRSAGDELDKNDDKFVRNKRNGLAANIVGALVDSVGRCTHTHTHKRNPRLSSSSRSTLGQVYVKSRSSLGQV